MPDKLHRHFQWIGVSVYLLALLVVSVGFKTYALKPLWWAWGIGTVLFFFGMSYGFYHRWRHEETRRWVRQLFFWALGIRTVYLAGIIFYYYYQTGVSFEYGAADSWRYHQIACYLANLVREGHWEAVIPVLNANTIGFSDQGYTLYLTTLYTCFGKNIIGPRVLKALMSAYQCVIIYKLASRNLDEKTARWAAVMAAFLPQFIHYTGTYLKETELVFLATLALERVDYLIHSRRYTFWNIAAPIVLTILTLGFRTIVGMALMASFIIYIVFCEKPLLSTKTRIVTVGLIVLLAGVLIMTPLGWEMYATIKVNFGTAPLTAEKYQGLNLRFTEYANGKYLFPGFLTLPLTNLVELANPTQKMMNGTYFVKNYLAFFALWCLWVAFREKQWRKLSLVGSYTILYAIIIAFSFAFNSERYHFPVMPGLLIMAAFAMTHFQKKDFKFYYVYCALLLIAIVAWNYLKLATRGLV